MICQFKNLSTSHVKWIPRDRTDVATDTKITKPPSLKQTRLNCAVKKDNTDSSTLQNKSFHAQKLFSSRQFFFKEIGFQFLQDNSFRVRAFSTVLWSHKEVICFNFQHKVKFKNRSRLDREHILCAPQPLFWSQTVSSKCC